jgi:acyl-CoA reductase-like NAD-dependent aldehyde dehydrogenase
VWKQLGGKDPAYVRSDADLDYTVAELVDGALFNSGQSCCAIEVIAVSTHLGFWLNHSIKRIYVHQDVYDSFVTKYAEMVKVGCPSSVALILHIQSPL